MGLYDIIEEAEANVERFLEEEAQKVCAEDCGLDPRCGMLWVAEDCVVIEDRVRVAFDYYGGFQYVDSDHINQVGRYVIYYADSARIMDAIESFHESEVELA